MSATISSNSQVFVNEGNTGGTAFNFTVTRSGSLTGTVSATWFVNAIGVDGLDFVGGVVPSGTVTFAPGETSQIVTVNVAGDLTVEPAEFFAFSLSSPSAGAVIGNNSASATIQPDDGAVISVTSGPLPGTLEGNAGPAAFNFTVTRTGDIGVAATADWTVMGSTFPGAVPADGADFVGGVLPSGTVEFAAGETTRTVTVNVAGDAVLEPDESFFLSLSNPSAGAVTGFGFTANITNDDGAILAINPFFSVNSEGNAGTTPFTFTVTRSGDLTIDASANWSVAPNTYPGSVPVDAADFAGGILPAGTVIFGVGETSKTITVDIAGDTAFEQNEGFIISLSNPSAGASVSSFSPGTSIFNDDGAIITFTGLTPAVNEGNAGNTPMVFNVVRSGDTSTAVSAGWSVNGMFSTANAADFEGGVLPAGIVNFAAGETSKTITINVAGDTVIEGSETVQLQLTGASPNATIGPYSMMTGNIANDDGGGAVISMGTSPFPTNEGNAGTTAFNFTVLRSGDLTSAVSANWLVASGQANGADFQGGVMPSGVVNFIAGQTSALITVNVVGDALIEGHESFGVNLTGVSAGASLGLTTSGFTTINNDDGAIISATNNSGFGISEGNAGSTPFNITITRSGNLAIAASATWTVAPASFGGATPVDAADFAGGAFPTDTVSFAAGETSKIITVNFSGNTVFEQNETFQLLLTNPSSGAAIGSMGTYQIINDDGVVIAFAGQPNPSVFEGLSGTTPITFNVARSGDTGVEASANWALNTFSSGANAADFAGGVLPSGTMTFAAGETLKTITVNVAGDSTIEPNEIIAIQLSGPSANATIGSFGQITGTITNDDPTSLAIAATGADQAEGNAGSTAFTFTVTRSGDVSGVSSVNWAYSTSGLSGGLANGTDFTGGTTPAGDTLTFLAGETTKTITVNVAGDTSGESDERFAIALSGATNGIITTSSATAVIRNDDAAIIGTSGNDSISPSGVSAGVTGGTPGVGGDAIFGNAGADVIDGGGGDDSINAGTGNDSIFGGLGNDTLNVNDVGAGDSGDNASGGEGNDLLLGYTAATGNFTNLNGGLGNDTINGNSLFENVADYAFYDRVSFVARTEALVAVLGASGTATLGAEVDTLTNVIHIRGTNQSDSFTGSNSNEYFLPGLGNDAINGGGGADRVEYGELTFAVNVNLTTNLALKNGQTDTLTSIEDITGSNYNDTLVGNAVTNVFRPMAGADLIDGGAAFDIVRYTTAFRGTEFPTFSSGVTINLTTGVAIDNWGFTDTLVSIERAEGSSLADDLTGKVITDTIAGGGSDTQLRGLGGNDILRAPQNDTRVHADYREDPGSIRVNLSGVDTVLGGISVAARTGRDGFGGTDSYDKIQAVLGSSSSDTIMGSERADRLWGMSGHDSLFGGAGDDTLGGAAGIDGYVGGAGFDVLFFTPYNSGDLQPTQGVVANLVTLTIANDGYGNAEVFAGGANDIEMLIGTNFGDDLTGAKVNWVGDFGEAQQTYLRGGNGADSIRGVAADARFITAEHLTDADLNGDGFGVTVNLATQTAIDGWGNTDTLFDIGAARGSTFHDSLIGNGGNNWFRGEAGNDTITGGLGRDLVSYRNSTSSVVLDFASGVVQDGLGGVDSLSGIEDVVGSATANDTLRGDAQDNSLTGYGGDDLLEGRGGNDALHGDTGNDVAVFSGALARYTVTRDTETGALTVLDGLAGGDGTDVLDADIETLRFSDGDVLASSFGAALPVLAIAATSSDKSEGNSGTTGFTFTVTRTGDTSGASGASYAVTGSGGNAAAAADFAGVVLPSGTVSFAAGETSKTVTVHVLGDNALESDEGFTVTLSAPTDATLGMASAGGTIRNDDALISLSGGTPVAEGNSGSTAVTFTVTRSGDTTSAVFASYAVTGTGGQPANAADFVGGVLPSGTVSFAAGETSKTVTVNVAGDTAVELNEEFTLTLSAPSAGASLGTASAARVITNDDSAISIVSSNVQHLEGPGGGTTDYSFLITRIGDLSGSASASWSVTGSGADAANGVDFVGGVLPSGTVSFTPGATIRTVTVSVQGDGVVEPDEGFTFTLSNPSDTTLGTSTASATIQNDDVATSLSIAALSADKVEGNSGSSGFTFTVTRTGASTGTSSAAWAVTGSGGNAAAAADFAGGVLASGTVSFAAGETSKTITVNVLGEVLFEADEGFTVTLSNPSGATLGTASAVGTIRNDDPAFAGTTGPDTLTGTGADEVISGLQGNDLLDGAGGNDTVNGDPGDDTLLASAGNDSLDGGAGIDTLVFGAGFAAINVVASLAVGIAHKGALGDDTLLNLENLTGNAGADTLTGNDLANALNGGGGADRLVGGLGNDSLIGGLGLDTFVVDAGVDRVTDLGLGGADVLVVSAGATANSTLAGAWTATAASSNAGIANLVASGFGVDLTAVTGANGWSVTNAGNATGVRLVGSLNADTLAGGEGNDTVLGGAGDDTLSGNGGLDTLLGGAGNDALNGGAGDDSLSGEADNDSLTGGLGNDTLVGGLGVDRFAVDAGTDTVTDLGLGGADVLVVSAGATANATLGAAWTPAAGNNNSGTANITAANRSVDLTLAGGSNGWSVSNAGANAAVSFTGSVRNDTLTGGNGIDTLNGGGGHDALDGGNGNDVLAGNAGNDSMSGGTGVDRFLIDAGTDAVLDLGLGGNDLLIVSAGAVVNATLAAAWIGSSNTSNAGVANLLAMGFNANLSAATGTTGWNVSNAGQAGAATLSGSGKTDRVTGGDGNDSLLGNAGDDTLTGNAGNDTILGAAGIDSLIGGLGDDLMTGGTELDRFVVDAGTDTVTDLGFGGPDVLMVSAGATANATLGGGWTASPGTNNAGTVNLLVAGFNLDLASASGASGWSASNAASTRAVRMVGSANADSLTGGTNADTIIGGAGNDTLLGGDGNDQLTGGLGDDHLTGGAGIDRFLVTLGADTVTDLGLGGSDALAVSAGATAFATLAADWVAAGGTSNLGVANLFAAGFDVTLTAAAGNLGWNVSNAGNASAVVLTGSSRADLLLGGDGADTLLGGVGNDTLVGGLGSDSLTGGLGADSFLYDSASAANGDVIVGFSAAQGDKVDLRPIDPDAAVGDQAFAFIGGAAFAMGVTGQLRFAGGMLEGDLDGDTVMDFQIQMTGVASLTAANIWL